MGQFREWIIEVWIRVVIVEMELNGRIWQIFRSRN